jgi:hypothetical protein
MDTNAITHPQWTQFSNFQNHTPRQPAAGANFCPHEALRRHQTIISLPEQMDSNAMTHQATLNCSSHAFCSGNVLWPAGNKLKQAFEQVHTYGIIHQTTFIKSSLATQT